MGLFTITRVSLFIIQTNRFFIKFLNQIIITCPIILLVKNFLEEGHMAAQWHFSSQQVAATQGPTHLLSSHSASLSEWLPAFDRLACVNTPPKLGGCVCLQTGHVVNSTVPTVPGFWKARYLFQSLMTWLRKATEPSGSQWPQSSPCANQKASLTKGSKNKLAPAQPTFSAFLRKRTPSCEFIDSPLRSSNGINFAFLVPAN